MYQDDPRKLKRYLRRHCDPLYEAYINGQYDAESRRGARNPYPPGRRHGEYERGAALADPMGDHHGSGL